MSRKSANCPICGQPSQIKTRPFCSDRCRDRDLLQWLGDGYRVPGAGMTEAAQKSRDYGVDSDPD